MKNVIVQGLQDTSGRREGYENLDLIDECKEKKDNGWIEKDK